MSSLILGREGERPSKENTRTASSCVLITCPQNLNALAKERGSMIGGANGAGERRRRPDAVVSDEQPGYSRKRNGTGRLFRCRRQPIRDEQRAAHNSLAIHTLIGRLDWPFPTHLSDRT